MRQIFISAFMLFSVFTAFAQHTVKGKVLDEKGNALVGATVAIQNSSLVRTTGKDGSFNFEKLSKNRYTLEASFVGFETSIHQANVDQDLVITLNPKTYSMDEITVSSLRATDKSPVAYTNIDKEALSKTNLGQDIPYLLSMTPSFVASSDAGTGIGYTGFRIRGTDATRINITINGIPYNDPDEQGAYWVDIPDFASSLQSIQIQRGVGTSTNGAGAFGANLNLQTENYAQKASGETSVTYGSFNTLKETVKASSGLINNHWAIDTRLSSVKSDGYIDRGSVDMKSYFVQAGYYDDHTSIKFLTFGGTEKTYHAWDGVPKDSLATHRTYNPCGFMGNDANGQPLYYQNQTDNYIQTNYQLLGVHSFSPEFSLNAGLHYTRGDGYYEEYQQDKALPHYSLAPFTADGTTTTNSDLVTQKKMDNNFAGGIFSLNYQKNKLKAQLGGAANNYWGNHFGDVIWVKNYIGDILPISEFYRSKVSKLDANIYLKANYELTSKLNVYADLQYRMVNYTLSGRNDQWDDAIGAMQILDVNKHFNFFNPKVGAYYRPTIHNDWYASLAIANREPTRTNYTDGTSATWPTSERLYDGEVGYKYHNDIYSFGVNGYFMYYHNQLILTGKIDDMGEMLTENIPTSYRLGIEFMGSVKPVDWLRWDASVTVSHNRVINYTEYANIYDNDQDWNWVGQKQNIVGSAPIAFSPEMLANSMITFIRGNFEAGFQSQYVGKQYVDNTGSNDRSLNAYFINSLRLSYSIPVKGIRGIVLSALVNNIFNEQYSSNAYVWDSYYFRDSSTPSTRYNDIRYFPQAGRNFLASVTLKF
ncbi:MAG: TonB-dependent receptor [Bacteroidota bacterium]|nr:TonB-dependent receptor [Bacteroidota bacterium]